MSIEIELTVFNDEHGWSAGWSIDNHVGGEHLVPALEIIASHKFKAPDSWLLGRHRVRIAMLGFLRVISATAAGAKGGNIASSSST